MIVCRQCGAGLLHGYLPGVAFCGDACVLRYALELDPADPRLAAVGLPPARDGHPAAVARRDSPPVNTLGLPREMPD